MRRHTGMEKDMTHRYMSRACKKGELKEYVTRGVGLLPINQQ